jgi:hypothetical protein
LKKSWKFGNINDYFIIIIIIIVDIFADLRVSIGPIRRTRYIISSSSMQFCTHGPLRRMLWWWWWWSYIYTHYMHGILWFRDHIYIINYYLTSDVHIYLLCIRVLHHVPQRTTTLSQHTNQHVQHQYIHIITIIDNKYYNPAISIKIWIICDIIIIIIIIINSNT